jgi:hypothetical protein
VGLADLLSELDAFDAGADDVVPGFPADGGQEGASLVLAEADVLSQPLAQDASGYDLHVAPLPVLDDPASAHHP